MPLKIALFGNPNCGKTTFFNNLTGSDQYVGNWPGVTVEKKEGFLRGNKEVKIIDLPGIYSLTPYTNEEVVSRNFLFFEKPDLILNVVSGVNLERSLYLSLQLLELNIPLIIVVSMMDKVKKAGGYINLLQLSKSLDCTVVEISNTDSELNFSVIYDAIKKIKDLNKTKQLSNIISNRQIYYSDIFEMYIKKISSILDIEKIKTECQNRILAIKCLEKDLDFYKNLNFDENLNSKINDVLLQAEREFKTDARSVLIRERYDKIHKMVSICSKNTEQHYEVSDKIDSILTNKFLAIPIFILVLSCSYYFCINLVGQPISKYMEHILNDVLAPNIKDFLHNANMSDWMTSLALDGIFAGVGTVLTFIPQVFMLFLFLSILEDCGYMARVAFILDKIFLKFGICGKSVISFLVSSGCGVNGIMATKTIKSDSKRFVTMATTTFIPCNAKFPIIAIICSYILNGSFMGIFLIYFLSIITVFIVSIIINKNNKSTQMSEHFIMELGPYIKPSFKNTLYYSISNVKAFVIKAGTVIFLASILIWFLLNFGFTSKGFGLVDQEKSLLAEFGKKLAIFFSPLGFGSWQAVVATISGLLAKENVVNSFAVILKSAENLTDGFDFNKIFDGNFSALSFLMFNMICAPCVAAMAAIYKQTSRLKLTLKILMIETVSAYIAGFIIYQIGGLIFGEVRFSINSILGFMAVFLVIFLLLKPSKKRV